jgi:hypothetical protein
VLPQPDQARALPGLAKDAARMAMRRITWKNVLRDMLYPFLVSENLHYSSIIIR